MESSITYARSPLFEVTVEFRTEPVGTRDEFERMERRFKSIYPVREQLDNLEFQVGPKPQVRSRGMESIQLRSSDAILNIALRTNGLTFTRSYPYTGWDVFSDALNHAWRVWSKEVRQRKVVRLGFRSRSRFDVPAQPSDQFDAADYITFKATAPIPGVKPGAFVAQDHGRLGNYETMIWAGTVLSPLIDHAALVLDIDLGRDIDVPREWADIMGALAEMRAIRTSAFELCITDRARDLIR